MINFLLIVCALASVVWVVYKVKSNDQKPDKPLVQKDDEVLPDGISQYKSQPQVLVDGVQIRAKDGTSVVLPLQVTSTLVVTTDEVFADLNRQATQARKEGDTDRAVELLQQAKQRQGDAYEDTRLALYLQHAGRLDESMAEFDWLLNKVDSQVENVFGHCAPIMRTKIKAHQRSKIHDKARLAAKRAGVSDLSSHHSKLAEKFAHEWESLKPAAEQAERERREHANRKAIASLQHQKATGDVM